MDRKSLIGIAALIGVAYSVVSCGTGRVGSPAPSPAATPSGTSAPSSGPAPNGYQLVAALPQATFNRMLELAVIPGSPNEAVIVTQGGIIYKIALDGSASPSVFGDLSGLLIANPGNEEGLLGLAFSPKFQSDGRLFVDYVAGDPTRSVLARFNVVDGAIDMISLRVILSVAQPFDNHKGGQLAFGPDGYLYWGLGDGGSEGDPLQNGQNISTLLSSILRIDVSDETYTVPPDNPFVNTPGAAPEKYAYGLRNPWRFSFDALNGTLWVGDVGQDKWEEVDRITAGGNYGWSIMEGYECYRTPNCDQTGLTLPRAVYGHDVGCAIMGGYVYWGGAMKELQGWFVYGDYCSGRVWALDTQSNSEPVLLTNSGHPIVSFGVLPDGELIALTFENAIYKLERAS